MSRETDPLLRQNKNWLNENKLQIGIVLGVVVFMVFVVYLGIEKQKAYEKWENEYAELNAQFYRCGLVIDNIQESRYYEYRDVYDVFVDLYYDYGCDKTYPELSGMAGFQYIGDDHE